MSNIDIKSSSIEKALDIAKSFLTTLVGHPIEEMGLLLADNVKMWRLKNQLRNLGKVQAIMKENNINPRQINLKVLFPYLEAVSLEEDERLHQLWANLIANYIDEKKNLESSVYPEVLKQLSTSDVAILDDFYSGSIVYTPYGLPMREDVNTMFKYTSLQLSNLERLGIIRSTFKVLNGGSGLFKNYEMSGYFQMSHFGDQFYKACHR